MSDFALVRVQSFQERGGKTPRGSQAGSGRNIRKRRDFYLRGLKILELQRFANDGMPDIGDLLHMLQCGIFQIDASAERAHDRDVNVLVDRGCNQKSFMLPVVRSKVGTAAA